MLSTRRGQWALLTSILTPYAPFHATIWDGTTAIDVNSLRLSRRTAVFQPRWILARAPVRPPLLSFGNHPARILVPHATVSPRLAVAMG
jgi:hypothetical protein